MIAGVVSQRVWPHNTALGYTALITPLVATCVDSPWLRRRRPAHHTPGAERTEPCPGSATVPPAGRQSTGTGQLGGETR